MSNTNVVTLLDWVKQQAERLEQLDDEQTISEAGMGDKVFVSVIRGGEVIQESSVKQ